jgi:hypothetical protein
MHTGVNTVSSNPDTLRKPEKTAMRFTVQAVCATQVRRALIAACAESAELLRTQILPHTSQVRVYFVVDKTAVDEAMRVLGRYMPRGEISRVMLRRA